MAAVDIDPRRVIDLVDRHVMQTYGRLPIAFVKGEGSRLWDAQGRTYLDFVAGIAVNALGHGHPRIKVALREAAESIIHTSNLYYIPQQAELAETLARVTGYDRIFFSNSGAEANEAAIKLARRYHFKKLGRVQRYEIITAENSFHGRTLATVTATGQPKYHVGFEPLPEGFRYVPLNDPEALKAAVSDKTAAIMLEPIQGEGGVNPCTDDYLRFVRELCDEHGILLIFDEIQTGVGRTGPFLAAEHYGVRADITSLAKGLGGGVPIGATMASDDVAEGFEPGSHASTFGGNPLAARAALAVLTALFEDGVLQAGARAGDRLRQGLESLVRRHASIASRVRGKGLMLGVDLLIDGKEILMRCLDRGLLVNIVGERILRLVPPLTVTDDEMDEALAILEEVFKECA